MQQSHANNFDGLRLLACANVLFLHIVAAPGSWMAGLSPLLIVVGNVAYSLFPGVPVFFIISGFLISGSYLRNPTLGRYARARFLRIWPALAVSTLLTTAILWAFGFFSLGWVFNQLSIVFIYRTPSSVSNFADGMPNGALWTIPVEVGFYLLVPLLLHGLVRRRLSLAVTTVLVGSLMLLALLLILTHNFGLHGHPNLTHGPLHHFWFFGCGMLLALHWPRLQSWFNQRARWWLAAHLCWLGSVLWFVHPVELGNLLTDSPANFLLTPTLPGLVMALAFSGPQLSRRCLAGTDISYGLYLVQSPYLRLARRIGASGLSGCVMVVSLALGSALLLWTLVEQPALAYKKRVA